MADKILGIQIGIGLSKERVQPSDLTRRTGIQHCSATVQIFFCLAEGVFHIALNILAPPQFFQFIHSLASNVVCVHGRVQRTTKYNPALRDHLLRHQGKQTAGGAVLPQVI